MTRPDDNPAPGAPAAPAPRAALVLLDGVVIPEAHLEVRFVRSSGPGGQNVNKVATKVELRLRLELTPALTAARKARLRAAFPSHVTAAGDFIVTSDRTRSQAMNLADARQRLSEMIQRIWRPPRPRIGTKPSRAARKRRLAEKRVQGAKKRERSRREFD